MTVTDKTLPERPSRGRTATAEVCIDKYPMLGRCRFSRHTEILILKSRLIRYLDHHVGMIKSGVTAVATISETRISLRELTRISSLNGFIESFDGVAGH
jgi:hypothetical protein